MRQVALSRIGPPPARSGGSAGPVPLIGTNRRADVAYFSSLAQALAGPQAATQQSFPPRQVTTPGWRIDVRA